MVVISTITIMTDGTTHIRGAAPGQISQENITQEKSDSKKRVAKETGDMIEAGDTKEMRDEFAACRLADVHRLLPT